MAPPTSMASSLSTSCRYSLPETRGPGSSPDGVLILARAFFVKGSKRMIHYIIPCRDAKRRSIDTGRSKMNYPYIRASATSARAAVKLWKLREAPGMAFDTTLNEVASPKV